MTSVCVHALPLICRLDLEQFLRDGLKGENLSKKAKERREAFIKRIKEVKLGYVCLVVNMSAKILVQNVI